MMAVHLVQKFLDNIGSGNGVLPDWHRGTTRTNADLLENLRNTIR